MLVLLLRILTVLRLIMTGLVLVLSGIGLAVFLIYYGVKAGLKDKRIRIYRLMDFNVTGIEAERYGWFYIIMGLISMAVFIRLVSTHYNWVLHLFRLKGS